MTEPAKNIPLVFALKQEAKYFNPPPYVQIFFCGMGGKNAANFTNEFIKTFNPQILFTCGFAGALNPELKLNSIVFSAPEQTAGVLKRLGAIESRFYCSTRVICSSKEKLNLYQQTGADAVEMESGIIKNVCEKHNVACVVIRVISDTAYEDLPLDFNELINANGKIKMFKLIARVSARPLLARRLLNFQKQTDAAARALGEFLNRFFKEII
ncbi:MAG: hypothetical protein ACP5MG_13840 [Verrucomicrobiia bacterium]|jgi:nucleoside phosphorylase